MEPIYTEDYKGCEIAIYRDDAAENPRDWGQTSLFYNNSRGYCFGDDDRKIEDAVECGPDGRLRVRGEFDRDNIWVPVYIYDHSGICCRTTPFIDSWDSGLWGILAESKENIRKEYNVKRIPRKVREAVERRLEGEVETMDAYCRGEVYGYVVTDAEGDEVDSCWGFFGDDAEAMDEAKSVIDYRETFKIKEYEEGKV